MWDKLPDKIAIHFDINNNPDNFSTKGFAVIGLPFSMAVLQAFLSIVTDLNPQKQGKTEKFENVMKWIIPVLSVVLQAVTLGYALGLSIDIRRVTILLVAVMFFVIGSVLPKLEYVKNYNIEPEKARKINGFIGRLVYIMGIIMFISIFLPPVASVLGLLLLIPCAILSVVYTIKVGRKK